MNRIRNHIVGRHSYNRFREVASFYLGMQPPLLGLVREQRAGTAGGATLTQQANAARDIDDLAQQLLAATPASNAGGTGTFRDRYLRATGHVAPPEPVELGYTVQRAADEGRDLQQQIADLSDKVDTLIAAMDRPASHPPQPATAGDNDLERWLAGLASGSQQVSADGETFALYHMQRSDNDVIHFACYSAAHEIETPESGSGSS